MATDSNLISLSDYSTQWKRTFSEVPLLYQMQQQRSSRLQVNVFIMASASTQQMFFSVWQLRQLNRWYRIWQRVSKKYGQRLFGSPIT